VSLEFSTDPGDVADGYIQWLASLGGYAALAAPRAEGLALGEGSVRLRWVGVGRRYIHPVYVYVEARGDYLVARARPPYPAYLLAVLGALAAAGMHPAGVLCAGGELRAAASPDYWAALAFAERLLAAGRAVAPGTPVFEGTLRRTGCMYAVAEAGEPVDEILRHRERKWWRSPLEAWATVVKKLKG